MYDFEEVGEVEKAKGPQKYWNEKLILKEM